MALPCFKSFDGQRYKMYTNRDALVANIEEQKRLNNTSLRLLQSKETQTMILYN
jgi:hypothetical protein